MSKLNRISSVRKNETGARRRQPFFQSKLQVNQPGDMYEQEADRVADQVMRRSRQSESSFFKAQPAVIQRKCAECEEERVQRREQRTSDTPVEATDLVQQTLSSGGGAPLPDNTRHLMESGIGHDFSQVRIHTGVQASASAKSIQAKAYTSGNQIVFDEGAYRPDTAAGQHLLAHELTHVVQQGGGSTILQRQPATQPAIQRQDIVFIMGDTVNDNFYKEADGYFRATYPKATFVTSVTTLDGILQHINSLASHIRIDNLYIVTHATPNGYLFFGLDASDSDTFIDPIELKEAVRKKSLTAVSTAIDSTTTIYIKGCNIGQNESVVNLIDVAFGGVGTVIAPTHEQVFGHSGSTFYQTFAGPTIQRPGSKKFTKAEVAAIVAKRYAHLSSAEQTALTKELFDGQIVEDKDISIEIGNIPQTEKQAIAFFKPHTANTLTKLISGPTVSGDNYEWIFEIKTPDGSTGTQPMGITVKSQATALKEAQEGEAQDVSDYSWLYNKTVNPKSGDYATTVKMTRVVSYLFERTLDAKSGARLAPPTTDKEFYTTSTAGKP